MSHTTYEPDGETAGKGTPLTYAERDKLRSTEWQSEYMSEFHGPDPNIRRLADKYHDECEAYDQIHCSGRDANGVAMPVNGHEMGMINRNAMEVRKRIIAEAETLGITWKDIQKEFNSRP